MTLAQRMLGPLGGLLLAGCLGGPTDPGSSQGDVHLETTIGTLSLGAADTTSLSIEIRNQGQSRVSFAFGSSCHLAVRLRDEASGRDVYQAEGGWLCVADLSGMALGPGTGRVVSLLLHGVIPMPEHLHGLHLDAGSYTAVTRFSALEYTLQSEPVHLTVR